MKRTCILICGLVPATLAFASDFEAVEFFNPYRDSLLVEIRVGRPQETGNTCEQNELLVERRLSPSESIKVNCDRTYGAFCVRTKGKNRSAFSEWSGTYTCGGYNALSATRVKKYRLLD